MSFSTTSLPLSPRKIVRTWNTHLLIQMRAYYAYCLHLVVVSYPSFSKTFPCNPLSLFFQGCILLNRGESRLYFSGPFPLGVRAAPASWRIFLCCILPLSTTLPWKNGHHIQELCLAVVWDPFHRSLGNTGFDQTLKMFDIRIFEKYLCPSWQSLIFDFHHTPLLFPGSPVPVSAHLCSVAPATWLRPNTWDSQGLSPGSSFLSTGLPAESCCISFQESQYRPEAGKSQSP